MERGGRKALASREAVLEVRVLTARGEAWAPKSHVVTERQFEVDLAKVRLPVCASDVQGVLHGTWSSESACPRPCRSLARPRPAPAP